MELTVKYDYAVDEYIHRLLMNNLSPRTVDNYKNILWRFGNFLLEYENAEDMYEVVEAWRDALTEQGASPSTVCQYLRVLKIFFGRQVVHAESSRNDLNHE